jgi:endonuclease I
MKQHTTLLLIALLLPVIAVAGIPEGYYNAANGKKKAELKAAMRSIIQPKKVLSYGSGGNSTWSGFYQTDRTSDGYVIDRYSPRTTWVKFSSSDNANSANSPSGMNIEHSFPKSWWGGSNNTAYKDLFNLMPSESGINSDKSNFAMGKVTNVTNGNGYTKVGKGPTTSGNKNLWEPADEWKGDFARDYFYMVTTYSNLTWTSNGLDMLENNEYPTMQQWAYKLLLQWAKQDPVDDIERKRNDDVYGIQQNRNPFVDFPNLAEYIWGDSVNYAFYVNQTSTGDDGGQGDDITPGFATLVNCSMTSDLGPFFTRTYEGCDGEVWTSSPQFGATASAYKLANKDTDEYMMVELDLTHAETATLTFKHATGYNKNVPVKDTYFQVLVSTNYDGVPEDARWTKLDATFPPLPTSNNFTSFVSSGEISLNPYSGQNITLAFRYTSNSSACFTWEVKDIKVTAYNVPDALPFIAEEEATEQVITYDMMGRSVPSNTKGIVIRNGRKILQR